jgi:Skp family chaperone for outer membrane proteins
MAVVLAVLGAAAGPLAAQEKPKTATVNIQQLFRGYYKTLETQAQINAQRAKIQKDNNEMLQRLQVFDERLRDMTRQLEDPAQSETEKKAVSRQVGMLFQEREALERVRKEGIQKRHVDLNRKMLGRMRGILEEIREVVRAQADSSGFDIVFDVEGLNSAQVPFLLYAKDATDITGMIQKELSKGAPAE